MTDENGNPIAPVVGGPDCGSTFFCRDFDLGDTFTPINDGRERPVYQLQDPGWGKRFVFVGWESNTPSTNIRTYQS